MDTTYSDVGGDTPYPQSPRRKKSADPLLDELLAANDASPSAPKLPPMERTPTDGGPIFANVMNDQGPTPVDPNNTGAIPPSPYIEPPPPAAEETPPASPTPNPTPPAATPSTDVGHDGVYNGMTREQWRDAWMRNTGIMTPAQVDAWMAANGATKVSDNGTFRTPYGETLDLGIGYRSGQVRAGFTGTGGGSGGSGSGSGGAGGGSGSGSGWQNDQLHAMLMHELQGLSGPFDANDPMIQDRVNNFRNEQARATQAARSAMAEKANFMGAGEGYQDAAIQSGIEDAGLRTASYQGEITAQEYERRRSELDRLLQMAISSSDSQAARELQAEISRLDREQQNSQFYDTMGYNINRDQNNLDYLMTQLLMGGGN